MAAAMSLMIHPPGSWSSRPRWATTSREIVSHPLRQSWPCQRHGCAHRRRCSSAHAAACQFGTLTRSDVLPAAWRPNAAGAV